MMQNAHKIQFAHLQRRIDGRSATWSCSDAMARIPLVVKDELTTRLDRAVALLSLQTGQRQTRTSFIVRAIEAEIERVAREQGDKAPTARESHRR